MLSAALGREVPSLVFCTIITKSTSYGCLLISWGLQISCTAMEKLSVKSLINCKMTYNKVWKSYCRSSYYYSAAHSSSLEGGKIHNMYQCVWWHVEVTLNILWKIRTHVPATIVKERSFQRRKKIVKSMIYNYSSVNYKQSGAVFFWQLC